MKKLFLFLSFLFLSGQLALAVETPARNISTDTSGFTKNLSSASTNQQLVDNVVDQLNVIASSPTQCSAGHYPLGIDTSGNAQSCTAASGGSVVSVTASSPLASSGGNNPNISISTAGTWSGNAGTAMALASAPTKCNAGYFPLGIDTEGNAQSCTLASTGSVTSVTASSPLSSSGGSTPNITFTNPGYITGNQSITLSGDVTGSGTTAITASVVKVNGASIPASATIVGTNSNKQIVAQTGTISNDTSGNAATATNASELNGQSASYYQTALGFTPYNATNPSGYISNITGLLTNGTNTTVSGSGTIASPYAVNASGGGITFTDGTNTVSGATQLTVTGGTVSGTSPNAVLTINQPYTTTAVAGNYYFTNQTTVTVTHNLNGYPIVQVMDSSENLFEPLSVVHNNANSFTVNFSSPTSGIIIYSQGLSSSNILPQSPWNDLLNWSDSELWKD